MTKDIAILVTGCAGFIGYHMVKRLLSEGQTVVGVDDMNAYYDTSLKADRLADLQCLEGADLFTFYQIDIADAEAVGACFERYQPRYVIHLAAQAGVRYSIDQPASYIHSNLSGFFNVIESCRQYGIDHLLYASSSSVYGMNKEMPLQESQTTAHPISLYAATKKSNELIAHAYSHLFDLPMTGMRFFSVYGPWGRPDMAYFKFTKAIVEGQTIDVYNHGDMYRDFTYIDDIVTAVTALMDQPPGRSDALDRLTPDQSTAPYRVLNLGSGTTVHLPTFISAIEQALGKEASVRYLPQQPGDVYQTYADVSKLNKLIGERKRTQIEEGVPRFVAWYRSYYDV